MSKTGYRPVFGDNLPAEKRGGLVARRNRSVACSTRRVWHRVEKKGVTEPGKSHRHVVISRKVVTVRKGRRREGSGGNKRPGYNRELG